MNLGNIEKTSVATASRLDHLVWVIFDKNLRS